MTATRTLLQTLTLSWWRRCRRRYTAKRRLGVGREARKLEGKEVRKLGGHRCRRRYTVRHRSECAAGGWQGRKEGYALTHGLGCQLQGARPVQAQVGLWGSWEQRKAGRRSSEACVGVPTARLGQVGLCRMPRQQHRVASKRKRFLMTTSPDNALRDVQGVADGQAPTQLREGDRKDISSSQGGPPQERGGTIPWHAALQLRSTPSDNATASGAGAGAGHGAGGLAGGERAGAAVVELNLASEPSLSRGRLVDGAAGDRGGSGSSGLGHGGLNLGGPLHQVQRSRTHAQLDLSGPTGGGGLAPERPPRSGGAAMSSGPGFSLNLGGAHAPAQQRQHQRDSAAQLSNLGRSRDSLGAGGSGAGTNGGDELNPHAPSRMASDTAHTLADFDKDVRPIGRKRLRSAAGERHIPGAVFALV